MKKKLTALLLAIATMTLLFFEYEQSTQTIADGNTSLQIGELTQNLEPTTSLSESSNNQVQSQDMAIV